MLLNETWVFHTRTWLPYYLFLLTLALKTNCQVTLSKTMVNCHRALRNTHHQHANYNSMRIICSLA